MNDGPDLNEQIEDIEAFQDTALPRIKACCSDSEGGARRLAGHRHPTTPGDNRRGGGYVLLVGCRGADSSPVTGYARSRTAPLRTSRSEASQSGSRRCRGQPARSHRRR